MCNTYDWSSHGDCWQTIRHEWGMTAWLDSNFKKWDSKNTNIYIYIWVPKWQGWTPAVDRCLQTCCFAILANMAQSGNGVMAVKVVIPCLIHNLNQAGKNVKKLWMLQCKYCLPRLSELTWLTERGFNSCQFYQDGVKNAYPLVGPPHPPTSIDFRHWLNCKTV